MTTSLTTSRLLGIAAAALIPALAAVSLGAQQPARETPPAPGAPQNFTLPAVRQLELPNGLKVTMVQYGTVPKATVRLVMRTGRIDETADQISVADLTRDLLLEGTTTRSAQQVAEEAAGYGGNLALNVGMNETWAGGDVLSEYMDEMIGLVADVVRNPRFPESELPRLKQDRLRSIAIQKSRQQTLAYERFAKVIYPNHPYGRVFPPEGQLQGYTIDKMRAFHAANFGARRSHVYVVGRFDEGVAERAIRAAFGDWQPGTAPQFTPLATTSRRLIHMVDRPGAVQTTIYLGLPVIDPSHRDYVPLLVTNAILGGSFGSRITSNIREQKGYTYSPFSTLSSYLKNTYWAEIADVTTNVTGASLKEIFFEIDRLQAEPPPASEVEAIQRYLAGVFVLQNSSRGGIVNQLQFTNLHGMGREYLTSYVQRVYAVTPADVQRIARDYLKDENMTIVIAGDRRQIEEQIKVFGTIVD